MRIALLILLVSAPVLAQEPVRVLTLEQALQTAQEHQPRLRQARATVRAADARTDLARSPMLPQVSASASAQRGSTSSSFVAGEAVPSAGAANRFSLGANASQLIWDFGRAGAQLDAAKANRRAREHDEQGTHVDVAYGVRAAFFQARAQKALLAIARERLANEERRMKQAESFVAAGTRPSIDLAQFRTQRANAQVQLVNAEAEYEAARARLNQAMGVERDLDFDVADDLLPPVAGEQKRTDELLPEAIDQRPELLALQSQLDAQQSSLRATRAAHWPSLSANAGLSETGSQLDRMGFGWSVGLQMALPVYQGGAVLAQTRESEANLDALQAQTDTLRQQVRLEVDQALRAVRTSQAALTASDEALQAAREQLDLAEARYEAGVGHAIEVGDAQLGLTSAAAQRVQSDYQLASARAQLLHALGQI